MKQLVSQAHFKFGSHNPDYLTNSKENLVNHQVVNKPGDVNPNQVKFQKGNFDLHHHTI